MPTDVSFPVYEHPAITLEAEAMTSNETIHVQEVRYLTRPGGRVAYEVTGAGPLVVLVPGMGDLRGTYRFLAPSIVDAGFRVAWTDLRGHGDSDASFASYGDVDTAGDIVALVEAGYLYSTSLGAHVSKDFCCYTDKAQRLEGVFGERSIAVINGNEKYWGNG